MQRRQFLRQAGTTLAIASTAGLAACARQPVASEKTPAPTAPPLVARLQSGVQDIVPIRAQTDRITGVYVCTRPFLAAGPGIETERLGEKTIVHGY